MLTREFLVDLSGRAQSAAIVPFCEVQLNTVAPKLDKCHENVAAWLEETRAISQSEDGL